MKNFEPDQLVLVRVCKEANWDLAHYSYCSDDKKDGYIHHIQGLSWYPDENILPYEGNEYLLGTVGEPIEKWQPEEGEIVAVSDDGRSWAPKIFVGTTVNGCYYCATWSGNMEAQSVYTRCEPLNKHFKVAFGRKD